MYPISDALRAHFEAGERKCARITLNNLTVEDLIITEADIVSDSLSIDRYCATGNKIEIGSAVSAELSVALNNSDGKFDGITFEGSELFAEIGIKGMADSYIPCGYFTVDEPPRAFSKISLKALDFMMRFDKEAVLSLLPFPCDAETLVRKMAEICEVNVSANIDFGSFPNKDETLYAPTTPNMTYRQLLQWVAEITGTCAFIDWNGELMLSWFETTSVNIIPAIRYSGDVLENDINITGVTVKTESGSFVSGTEDYSLSIDGNELIYGGTEQYKADNIYDAVSGFKYRPYECSCMPMPYLYPLDKITYTDKDGNVISTVITNHTFGLNSVSAIAAQGETQQKKSYALQKQLTKKEINAAIAEALKNVDNSAEHIYVKYSPYDGGINPETDEVVWSDEPDDTTVYLGTCATNEKTMPDDPTKYKWVRVRGADGQNGQNGHDGKGIEEIKNYYLASAQQSGITRENLDWTTDVAAVNEDKPYLWNYEEIIYTVGDPAYTEPCIIGNFAKDGIDGEDGENGRGIKSITEYYCVTQTEATPDKTSFVTDVQTPTETLPFLWNYEKIEYTDDSTPYESEVRIIGVYGTKGENGETLYTWVRYADDASGANISDSPTGKKYIGIATNKTTETESNVPSDYKWSLIKGTDGRGVSKVETEYYLSTSESTLVGGSWSTQAPTWVDGRYLWTRLVTTYTDGDTEESAPVVDASWKKTTAVESASKELNETLANALGLCVTQYNGVWYYHSNPKLESSVDGDTILALNSGAFGVCTTGWNGGKPDFKNGALFGKGELIWNILTANKINADLIEAGKISSVDSAKVQSCWDLNSGEMTFENNGVKMTIHGTLESNGTEIAEPGVSLYTPSTGEWIHMVADGVGFRSDDFVSEIVEWTFQEMLKVANNPNYEIDWSKQPNWHMSLLGKYAVQTKQLYCEDLYLFDGESDNSATQINLRGMLESLSALQTRLGELETALGQQHTHTNASAVRENVIEATCTSGGSYDSVVYCATCGEEISRTRITTQATGHSDSNGDGYCDVCGVKVGVFYTITVQSNDTSMGTVSGGGSYVSGKTVAITATPKTGYKFVKWSDSNTNATRTITVTGNATYTATFEVESGGSTTDTATFKVSKDSGATSDDYVMINSSSGTVLGTTVVMSYGDSFTIYADTIEGRQITGLEMLIDGVSAYGIIPQTDLESAGWLLSNRVLSFSVDFNDTGMIGVTREYKVYFATA